MKTYYIKEIFYSLQGEGKNVGIPSVFVRFAGCNLQCSVEVEGFDCDTDFRNGSPMTATEIVEEVLRYPAPNVILTGGEPLLQLDVDLAFALRCKGRVLFLETNGTKPLPREGEGLRSNLRWIVCSPHTPLEKIQLQQCDELRLVVRQGDNLEWFDQRSWVERLSPRVIFISPAWEDGFVKENIDWCVDLVKQNPWFTLSLQTQKLIGIR